MKISARNHLSGRVIAVQKGDVTAIIKIELKIPATVTALITRESTEELKIQIGDEVEAIVKATEVMIAK